MRLHFDAGAVNNCKKQLFDKKPLIDCFKALQKMNNSIKSPFVKTRKSLVNKLFTFGAVKLPLLASFVAATHSAFATVQPPEPIVVAPITKVNGAPYVLEDGDFVITLTGHNIYSTNINVWQGKNIYPGDTYTVEMIYNTKRLQRWASFYKDSKALATFAVNTNNTKTTTSGAYMDVNAYGNINYANYSTSVTNDIGGGIFPANPLYQNELAPALFQIIATSFPPSDGLISGPAIPDIGYIGTLPSTVKVTAKYTIPAISISANSSTVNLLYPTNASPLLAVYCSSNLVNWAPLPTNAAYTIVGTNNQISLPITKTGNQFFNLIGPNEFATLCRPPAPSLKLQRSVDGKAFSLTWPQSSPSSYSLYSTTNLLGAWEPATNAVSTDGTNYSVKIDSTQFGKEFYRLMSQNGF